MAAQNASSRWVCRPPFDLTSTPYPPPLELQPASLAALLPPRRPPPILSSELLLDAVLSRPSRRKQSGMLSDVEVKPA